MFILVLGMESRLLRHCVHFRPEEAANMFKALSLSGFADRAVCVSEWKGKWPS